MSDWNPFRAPSGIKQGLKVRQEFEERKRLKQARGTVYFGALAGREATYRHFMSELRDTITSIESLDHAMSELCTTNRGRLTVAELEALRRLSPSQIVDRHKQISPEDLATLYLLVGRMQYLGRQRDSVSSPLGVIFASQTHYYQNLPTGDRRRLPTNQTWNIGDSLRPFNGQAFDQFRSQQRRR